MKLRIAFLAAGLLLLRTAPAAAATLTFNFTPALQVAFPGQLVSFTGVLTNTGLTTAFINGDSITSIFSFDDTPFLIGAPLSLAPGAFYIGPVLDISVPFGATPGLYPGIFNVLGGDTLSDFNVLTSTDFAVQVVPEPSTWFGVLGGVVVFWRVKAQRGKPSPGTNAGWGRTGAEANKKQRNGSRLALKEACLWKT